MCSGVGITMVGVAALAVLLRRGLRGRALDRRTPALLYVVWWATYGREGFDGNRSTVGRVGRFATRGVTATFDNVGQVPGVAFVLAALLVAGAGASARTDTWAGPAGEGRHPRGLPGRVRALFVVAGVGRAAQRGVEFATRSRYSHLGRGPPAGRRWRSRGSSWRSGGAGR